MGIVAVRSNQHCWTNAGSCRWSPTSSSFCRDLTASTEISVGSITSQASSTTAAKGSAARTFSRRREIPTTVAPTIIAFFMSAAPDSSFWRRAWATSKSSCPCKLLRCRAIHTNRRLAAACLCARSHCQDHCSTSSRATSIILSSSSRCASLSGSEVLEVVEESCEEVTLSSSSCSSSDSSAPMSCRRWRFSFSA